MRPALRAAGEAAVRAVMPGGRPGRPGGPRGPGQQGKGLPGGRPTGRVAYGAGGPPGGTAQARAGAECAGTGARSAGGLPHGRPTGPAGYRAAGQRGGRPTGRAAYRAGAGTGKALGADVLSPDTTVLASTLEDGVEDVPLSAPVNGPRWKTSAGIRRFKSLFSTLSQVGTSSKNTSRVCPNRTSSKNVFHGGRRFCQRNH